MYGVSESFVLHNTSNERLTDDSHGRSLSVRVRKIDRVVLKKTRYRLRRFLKKLLLHTAICGKLGFVIKIRRTEGFEAVCT